MWAVFFVLVNHVCDVLKVIIRALEDKGYRGVVRKS